MPQSKFNHLNLFKADPESTGIYGWINNSRSKLMDDTFSLKSLVVIYPKN